MNEPDKMGQMGKDILLLLDCEFASNRKDCRLDLYCFLFSQPSWTIDSYPVVMHLLSFLKIYKF